MSKAELNITNNEQENRFEAPVGNEIAFIGYRWQNGKLALMHTEVPEEAEGQGIAAELATFAFDTARKEQRKVLIYCPYISTFIKRHPEYNDVVEKDYNA